MANKNSGTSFQDAVRIINNPKGIHYSAYVSGVRTAGHMKCGPPPWDPHGVYQLGLDGQRLVIQQLLDGSWVESPTTQPSGMETPAARTASTTVNHYHAPVGAVAATAGATAYGTVVVEQVDAAMRRVVERQDDLGDLTDTLLPLLRTVRRLERSGTTEAELRAAVAEADEFRAFEDSVKPGLSRAAASAAMTIIELVPPLKGALALFGGS